MKLNINSLIREKGGFVVRGLAVCLLFAAILSLVVGCSDASTSIDMPTTKKVSARANSEGKGLSVQYIGEAMEDYYWFYTAINSSGLGKGRAETYTPWKDGETGLESTEHEFSVGDWSFSFRACKTPVYSLNNVVFEGTVEHSITIDSTVNRLYVPAQYVDVAYSEDGSTYTTLTGKIVLDGANISTTNEDMAKYALSTSNLKRHTTITSIDGTLLVAWNEANIAAGSNVTSRTCDAGIYQITMLYEYYDSDPSSANAVKVASYIVVDTLSVHGNVKTQLSGEFNFIRLEKWRITYNDGAIKYTNGRAQETSRTNNGYTGTNRLVLLSDYSTYEYGTGISIPTATSPSDAEKVNHLNYKQGYTFSGWFSTDTNTLLNLTSPGYGALAAGNKTVYAMWTPVKSTITYNNRADSGSTDATIGGAGTTKINTTTGNAYFDDYLPAVQRPLREGYRFAGYYLDAAGTSGKQIYTSASGTSLPGNTHGVSGVKSDEGKTTITNASGYYQLTTNTTFYAKWLPESYTLRFNANKSSYAAMIDNPTVPADMIVTFDKGVDVTSWKYAENPGWKFEGWGVAADAATPTNAMLYDRQGVVSGTNYISATNANWIYDGSASSFSAGGSTVENNVASAAILPVYAKWTAKPTHITLDKGKYGLADGTAKINYDSNVTYAFTAVTSNATTNPKNWQITGYYTAPEGGIKVLNADGTLNTATSSTELAAAGYLYDASSHKVWHKHHVGDDVNPLEITLYAHWGYGVYNLYFNPMDSGEGYGSTDIVADVAAKTVTVDNAIATGDTIGASYRKGYIFGGWYLDRITSATNSGVDTSPIQLFDKDGKVIANVSGRETGDAITNANKRWVGTHDRTVYAKWTPEVATITYNFNRSASTYSVYYTSMSSNPTISSRSSTSGKFIFDEHMPAFVTATNTGWAFKGWMTGFNPKDANTVMLSNEREWLPAGSGANAWISSSLTWVSDTNATYASAAGSNRTATLYAKWEPAHTVVRLEANGAAWNSGVSKTFTVDYDMTEAAFKSKFVAATATLDTSHIIGYYTVPQIYAEAGYTSMSDAAYKVLNADGSFSTGTDCGDSSLNGTSPAAADKSAVYGSSSPYHLNFDHGFRKFFTAASSSGRWCIYNQTDPAETEYITLYAWYTADPELEVQYSTDIEIVWNYGGRFGIVGDGGNLFGDIGYGDTFMNGYVQGTSLMADKALKGLYLLSGTDYIAGNERTFSSFSDWIDTSRANLYKVFEVNGQVNNTIDPSTKTYYYAATAAESVTNQYGVPLVKDGKWVYLPDGSATKPSKIKLYAIWD